MTSTLSNTRTLVRFAILATIALAGCSASEKKPTGSFPPDGNPNVTALVPTRTVVGDTVLVQGTGFGAQPGNSTVLFTAAGGTVAASVVPGSWSDVSIRVLLPAGAVLGPVIVRRDGSSGTGVRFDVAPRLVTYHDDLLPLFQLKGCITCHGGDGGLTLTTRESLLHGGAHGPVAIPRRSSASNLVRKLGASLPFGERMPKGGAPLTTDEIRLVADWIDQGVRPDEALPPMPTPSISELLPPRTVAGDTVVVMGNDFGSDPAGSGVRFTAEGGGTIEAAAVEGGWSDTAIRILVPAQAVSGPVVVHVGQAISLGKDFDLAPRVVSYTDDVVPLFENRGCASCHGGQNNLFVTPRASLLLGNSTHGPAVRPRRSAQSLIVQVLGDSRPFGLPRMPQGSPALSAAQIRLVSDWVDQGARDN
jgi:hypothetical protein